MDCFTFVLVDWLILFTNTMIKLLKVSSAYFIFEYTEFICKCNEYPWRPILGISIYLFDPVPKHSIDLLFISSGGFKRSSLLPNNESLDFLLEYHI